MITTKTSTQLIQAYLTAVVQHVPAAKRDKVTAAVSAAIDTKVAELSAGKKPTATIVAAALEALGDPEIVARRYSHSKRYLIGPLWYDMYIRVLRQLLMVVPPIVLAVVLLVELAETRHFVEAMVQAVGGAIVAGIQVAFWTTLGFVIAERAGADPKALAAMQPWTVASLPAPAPSRQISKSEGVTGVIAATVLLVVVAYAGMLPGPWSDISEPLLDAEIWRTWLPVFLVLSGLMVLQEIAKLQIGNWVAGLVASNILLSIATAVSVCVFLLSQDVVNPGFIAEIQSSHAVKDIDAAIEWLTTVLVVVTLANCIWSVADSVVKGLRYARKP